MVGLAEGKMGDGSVVAGYICCCCCVVLDAMDHVSLAARGANFTRTPFSPLTLLSLVSSLFPSNPFHLPILQSSTPHHQFHPAFIMNALARSARLNGVSALQQATPMARRAFTNGPSIPLPLPPSTHPR